MLAGILILVLGFARGVPEHQAPTRSNPPRNPQSFAARLARMPVWLGFVLFIAAWAHPFGIVAMRRTVFSDSMGVAICALGLLVAIWSRKALGTEWSQDVELKERHKLVQGGPYRFMHHPIFTGHLLIGLGTAIASGLLIAFVGLASFAVGFWVKLNQKEGLLLRSFPDQYPAYKTRVKALIPYLFFCSDG